MERSETDGALAERFSDFARAFRSGAPLYARFAERVSREPEVLAIMSAAPPSQRIPVLLFAAVQYSLFQEPWHPLARHYPSLDSATGPSTSENMNDAADEFVRFITSRSEAVSHLLRTRSVQTNEVGRSSWFIFPFAILDREMGPLARVDIGSSAGLTLLFPDMTFDLGSRGALGDSRDLVLHCELRNCPPTPFDTPRVVWSLGLDSNPVDLHDDDAVRWLEACLWPENTERMQRFRSAVTLARFRGITVESGDALIDLATSIERARVHGHPVVTTTWVLNYLSPDARTTFVAELDRLGAKFDLSWVIAESPRETPELPVPTTGAEDITVLSLISWRAGRRTVRRLATTHPHGNWINWEYRELI
ncbi:MAG: DUF2332 domain-containing protein [Ilumatobacteraceae bacterium]